MTLPASNDCCLVKTGCNVGCIVQKAEADTTTAYKNDCVGGKEGCSTPSEMFPVSGAVGLDKWPGMPAPVALTGVPALKGGGENEDDLG